MSGWWSRGSGRCGFLSHERGPPCLRHANVSPVEENVLAVRSAEDGMLLGTLNARLISQRGGAYGRADRTERHGATLARVIASCGDALTRGG